jgi:hypothetical protein
MLSPSVISRFGTLADKQRFVVQGAAVGAVRSESGRQSLSPLEGETPHSA